LVRFWNWMRSQDIPYWQATRILNYVDERFVPKDTP
jgi:hypothetical protein